MRTRITRAWPELKQKPFRLLSMTIIVYMAVVWSWLLLIDAAQLAGNTLTGIVLAVLVYITMVTVSSLIAVSATRFVYRYYHNHAQVGIWFVVGLFVLWAAIEWVVAHAVALLWMGQDGSWDTSLPFGSLTPWLMYTPLRFLARLLGYYGLSAAVGVFVVVFLSKKLRRLALPYGLVLVGLTIFAWGWYRTSSGVSIEAVIAAEQLDVQQQIVTDADLVLLPEYGLDDVPSDTSRQRVVSPASKEVFFIGSHQDDSNTESGAVRNTLTLGSATRGFISEQAKTRLIPGSEYVPFSVEILLRAAGADETLLHFAATRAVEKGEAPIQPLPLRDGIVAGSEVCSSIIAPEDYRRLVASGATLLTNSASLGVFRGSLMYQAQHEGLARFMATANARPFLQSSSGGRSLAVDHQGTLIASTQPVSTMNVIVQGNQRLTPYARVGEWPVILGLMLLFALLAQHTKVHYFSTAIKTKIQ